ncbi:uncharacterized protein LOC126801003 [Argentina anserina]|uniref:uncharacterized protein LOC126801003 n=1 Tax=Argentina anserina TaxID=57926 RepID=UPI0021769208|nr:uncharacterized protein LOC126801003 [Potentilla anserina]
MEKLIAEFSEIGKNKNIDEDVVEQILSTLPPKSLMRFKCVSKNWYAQITSPRFIAKHLSHSMHKKQYSSTSVLLKRLVGKDTNTDETEEVFSLLNFHYDNDHDGTDKINEYSFSCEDVKIPHSMSQETRGESLKIIGHCNGIICLATADSWEVLLWNPAIEEFKLLPTMPPSPACRLLMPYDPILGFGYDPILGFGYDPKSNNYKVVNVYTGLRDYEKSEADDCDISKRPTTEVYTLGTDSWREGKNYSLETQTTLLQPERFEMYFQGFCFWFGYEQLKEINVYDAMEESAIRDVFILFDMENEVFDGMPLPSSLYDYVGSCAFEHLLVWNESIAFSVNYHTWDNIGVHSYYLGIWVVDEFHVDSECTWKKHFTIEILEKPLAFLKSDEILMADANGCLFSYNIGTKIQQYIPIQRVPSRDSAAVVYVDSIVPLLEGNKTGDNSTSADSSIFKYLPISRSMADNQWYSYSVWAFPPDDVSLRIKSVMDGLRAEFGGPEIEPHIPLVGSIRMTRDEVLSKFRSLQSHIIYSYKAEVVEVVTREFYYQSVSLLIDSNRENCGKLFHAARTSSIHFGMHIEHRPRLSLLCGNLTGEQRKIAQEKVSIMDESITSLSFPITRLGLYEINYRDTTLKSWKKISEYPLVLN